MMRTIGVTGAAGHLGGVLVRRLIEKGYRVKAFCHRDVRALEGLAAELVWGDVLDSESVAAFAHGCDVVVHCAAIISITGAQHGLVFRSNTEGPRNVVAACIKADVPRLIHVSSVHAVKELSGRPVFDETNPRKEKDSPAYDYSKACGEQIVLEAFRAGTLSGCIMRPSAIFGPYDFKPSKLGQATLDLYRGHIPVLPPGGYNFVDVRDVAEGICSAISAPSSVLNGPFQNLSDSAIPEKSTEVDTVGAAEDDPIFNLTGRYCSMNEYASLIEQQGGHRSPRISLTASVMVALLPFVKLWARATHMEQAYTGEMIHALTSGHRNMRSDRARKAFGFNPRPLEETVQDFIAWEKERGNL